MYERNHTFFGLSSISTMWVTTSNLLFHFPIIFSDLWSQIPSLQNRLLISNYPIIISHDLIRTINLITRGPCLKSFLRVNKRKHGNPIAIGIHPHRIKPPDGLRFTNVDVSFTRHPPSTSRSVRPDKQSTLQH